MISPAHATMRSVSRMIDDLAIALEAPIDPLEKRVASARAAAKKKDILAWGKAVMPEKFNLPFCKKMHEYFVSIRHEPFTDTEAPRDHAKTTIKCNLIPLFQALEEPKEFDYYLNVQSTEKKGLAVNVSLKLELEQNEVIREIYGDQVGDDKWTDLLFVTRKGVAFQALGAGQSIRGTNYRNRRPNYLIVDDLYDEPDINNPDSTKAKNDWFWGTLYPAMAENRPSSVHVQGTAINREDLLVQLKGKKGVKYRSFKSIISDAKKKVLWPELKSYEKRVAQRSLMPSIIFAREYQNARTDGASAIIKSEWLTTWEYDPALIRFDIKHALQESLLSIDPSIGEKNTNDPTAYVLVRIAQRDDGSLPLYYIEGAWNKLMSLQERLNLLREIVDVQAKGRELTRIKVETIAGFKDFGTLVAQNTPVPTTMIDKVPDKITHTQKKSHYFENRRVFLNKNIDPELKREIVYQLTTNYPTHDDLRDAILHAFDDESTSWKDMI